MRHLVLEAYNKAKTNEFFEITIVLERLIKRRYSGNDPRGNITTEQVRQVLDSNGMDYTISGNSPKQV